MSLLDRLMPGKLKSDLKLSIEEVGTLARLEIERQELSPNTSILWQPLCDATEDILRQLVVDNTNKQLDWGLKGKRHRINRPRLAVICWWLLMHQIVIFKNRGVEGLLIDNEVEGLIATSHGFIQYIAQRPDYGFTVPGLWDSRWSNQVSLEASMGVYNSIMQMLGLTVDLDQRILSVSLFTSATERAFDSTVRGKLAQHFER